MSISVTDGKGRVAVVAIGGNALILDKQHEDVGSQVGAVEETCKHIANMIERGWNVIVTHGNGPQVGFILRRNELAAHEVHSTPSIGVALFDGRHNAIDELLKQADLAMYQAKTSGRNTLRFFDVAMQSAVSERAVLESELREALVRQEFVLYYQPQVVGDARITGAEALVRWQHPQRGIVPPAAFISLAEETGLIVPLGAWVLETACAQLAQWALRAETAQFFIAVNVSAKQMQQEDFVNQVLTALRRTGAQPSRLKLELTESLLVTDVENTIAKMAALKLAGVGFSLDDFGTGYSSLTYLKRLPLDHLKIDQGFVRDILTDPNDAAIAKMVIALAASLVLTVIAEGVELEAQRIFLARHGCHAYQGYLMSRPLPIGEFEALVLPASADLSPAGRASLQEHDLP
jgi:EAL domain-containing protein (putative c-di-GMP-specific phosphodiesterase class I)